MDNITKEEQFEYDKLFYGNEHPDVGAMRLLQAIQEKRLEDIKDIIINSKE